MGVAAASGVCCCESFEADAKIVDVEIVQRRKVALNSERDGVAGNDGDQSSAEASSKASTSAPTSVFVDAKDVEAQAARRKQYAVGLFLKQCSRGRRMVILKPIVQDGKTSVDRKDGTLMLDASIPALTILTGGKVALQRMVNAIEDVYTVDDGGRCIPTAVTEALSEQEAQSVVRIVFKADPPTGFGGRSPSMGSSPTKSLKQSVSIASSIDVRPSGASERSTSPCSVASSVAPGRSVLILEESRECRDRLLESLKFLVVSTSSPKRGRNGSASPSRAGSASPSRPVSSLRGTSSLREDRLRFSMDVAEKTVVVQEERPPPVPEEGADAAGSSQEDASAPAPVGRGESAAAHEGEKP
mmetsp:Transcript_523/g.1747  ORF Transcript_523/g.1747 Transcript_523/m.1747 type:complete len:358 (+) Transcript_523:174-1247(+)